MKSKKDKVLQEIFDNDPMGILDDNFEAKGLPDKWWDKGINPVLGYKWEQKPLEQRPRPNKNLYPKELDYKPD